MGSADVENIKSKDPPLPLALLMGHNPETALCYQADAPSLSQKKGKNITLCIQNTKDSELRATQCFRFLRCTHEVGHYVMNIMNLVLRPASQAPQHARMFHKMMCRLPRSEQGLTRSLGQSYNESETRADAPPLTPVVISISTCLSLLPCPLLP